MKGFFGFVVSIFLMDGFEGEGELEDFVVYVCILFELEIRVM